MKKAKEVVWVLFFLILLVVIFFSSQIGNWQNFLYRPGSQYSDLTITFWPNINYIQNSFKYFHQLPLWRTLIYSGTPFDSDPQSGLWYFPNLLFMIFPATIGFNVLFCLHLIAAGVGMWIWSRTVGVSVHGAFLASISFAFCPKVIAHLGFGHVGLYYATAYIPWLFWATYQIGNKKQSYIPIFGILYGIQIIANPQIAFYTGLICFVYMSVCGFEPKVKTFSLNQYTRSMLAIGIGFLIAILISAVQIIPMLRYAPLIGRQEMALNESAISSLPFKYLIGLLLADHHGYMEYMLYVGIGVLFLAVMGITRRHGLFWWIVIIFCFIYALGINLPFYQYIYRLIPLLSWLRSPGRILFIAMAGFSFLAGNGYDRLFLTFSPVSLKRLNILAFSVSVFAIIFLLAYTVMFGIPHLNIIIFGLLTPAFSIIIMLCANRKMVPDVGVVVFAVLTLVDLWIIDGSLIEGRTWDQVNVNNELARFLYLKNSEEKFRIYSPSYSISNQATSFYRLERADGVDPLYLRDYDLFMQAASGVKRSHYEVTIPAMEGGLPDIVNLRAIPNLRLLSILNVKYLASEFPIEMKNLHKVDLFGKSYLYENILFMPRVFFADSVIAVDNIEQALKILTAEEKIQIVTVEDYHGGLVSFPKMYSVKWLESTPNRISLEIQTDTASFLVISNIYHPDWKAEVDNKPVKLYKTDGIVSGLYLSPGNYHLVLCYKPLITYIGAAVSILTLLFSLSMVYKLQLSERKVIKI